MGTNRKTSGQSQRERRTKINFKELASLIKKAQLIAQKNRNEFISGNELSVYEVIINDLSLSFSLEKMKLLLELMQLSKDTKVYKRLKLLEIGEIYKILCKAYKNDIDLNLEYYYFMFNVLDKEDEATKFIKKYKKYIINKMNDVL